MFSKGPAGWRFGAVAFVLVPLFLLLLPALLVPMGNHTSPEEHFAALAGEPAEYTGFFLQSIAAVCLPAAAVTALAAVRRRRRGLGVARVGAALGWAGAVAALLLLGMEFAQAFLLAHGPDEAAMVSLALAINEWALFVALLVLALAGALLGLPILSVALARAGVVPPWVLLLFLLPVAGTFIPLGAAAANVVPAALFLVPCGVISALLLRSGGEAEASVDGHHDGAADSPARPRAHVIPVRTNGS